MRALSICDVLALNKRDFDGLLGAYPSYRKKIYSRCDLPSGPAWISTHLTSTPKLFALRLFVSAALRARGPGRLISNAMLRPMLAASVNVSSLSSPPPFVCMCRFIVNAMQNYKDVRRQMPISYAGASFLRNCHAFLQCRLWSLLLSWPRFGGSR